MNRRINIGDAVFGKEQHLDGAALEKRNQIADDGVDLPEIALDGGVDLVATDARRWICIRVARRFHRPPPYVGGYARPMALEVVIQVRQVNEVERRLIFVFDPLG